MTSKGLTRIVLGIALVTATASCSGAPSDIPAACESLDEKWVADIAFTAEIADGEIIQGLDRDELAELKAEWVASISEVVDNLFFLEATLAREGEADTQFGRDASALTLALFEFTQDRENGTHDAGSHFSILSLLGDVFGECEERGAEINATTL